MSRGQSTENRALMVSFTILFLPFLVSILVVCSALDTITTTQPLRDGDHIVSINGSFELGFFSPRNSSNRYLGIWYKNIQPRTVVWVANRKVPVSDASGVLQIISPGVLVLSNGSNTTIWSSNSSRSAQERDVKAINPTARLLDTGNLVIKNLGDDDPENFMWGSFDYPSDTLLPGMKLGKNLVTGHEWFLSSWKSEDDPSPGAFTYYCDPSGYPQLVLKRGSSVLYASGPWNGRRFSGMPNMSPNLIYHFRLVYNEKEVYYSYELISSTISRYLVNYTGVSQRWTWSGTDQSQGWDIYLTRPTDICDDYAKCGVYGICDIGSSPVCGCLDKFVPNNSSNDGANGCIRRVPLDCRKGDGFLRYSNVKLPDTRGRSWLNSTIDLKKCRAICLTNCTCMAYASLNISGGASGCLLWFGELLNMRVQPPDGQHIYVRMASSEIGGSSSKKRDIIIASLVLSTGMLLLSLCLTLHKGMKKKSQQKIKGTVTPNSQQGQQNTDTDLLTFDFGTLANATNNFSTQNWVGQGGFGPVYKGVLEGGQEIAVKRLSKNSNQGLDEFKNEVIYIARLQHRNLVKLLGCCIQEEEKMLVYEYMPNNSLESFIFDQRQSRLLDWPKRFHVINGIARGLLYLHQDSRLIIIHRDLKASNILLDINMDPKISDFGVARSFKEDEIEANTTRVVGTHGYMSPEYAMDGLFSTKSDVFSFGILLLEIVSGKKSRGFINSNHRFNLLAHAWRLFNEGRSFELIDVPLDNLCYLNQALRTIHVGLLCVQQCPEDRPSMSSVVLMLHSEGELVRPQLPGFFTERSFLEANHFSSKQIVSSTNEITITLLEGR